MAQADQHDDQHEEPRRDGGQDSGRDAPDGKRGAHRPPAERGQYSDSDRDVMQPDPAGLEDLNVTRPAPVDVEREADRK